MSLSGIRTGIAARGRRGFRRVWLLGATMTLALVLAGCIDSIPSTNTYPIDFFSEMHYSKAWTAGEPDGLNPPAGSVPITGGEVAWEFNEVADLENPYESNGDLGQAVYELNCQHCHGPEGAGDGPIAAQFEFYDAPLPSNLQETDLTDGEIYHVVTYGLNTHMPAFRQLLTEEQRWAVVEHLRSLQ